MIKLLITDVLFWTLLVMVVLLIRHIRSRVDLTRNWLKLLKRPVPMIALTVLCFYVFIALLDSIHYRVKLTNGNGTPAKHYSAKLKSVLDAAVSPLDFQKEKTYSAPLALNSYSTEQFIDESGQMQQVYPRLKYVDPALQSSKDVRQLVVRILFSSGFYSLLLISVMVLLVAWLLPGKQKVLKRLHCWRLGQSSVAIRSVWLTLAAIVWLTLCSWQLSQHIHILGTDSIGEDVFYQALKSIRTGVLIGTLTTFVMLPLAVFLGAFAGFLKGWWDDVIQYVYTTLSAIPGVLLIAATILMLQVMINEHSQWFTTVDARSDLRLLALCLILGVTSWTSLCRLVRAEVMKLHSMDYITAARALGISTWTNINRHIIPNVMHIILITVAMDFSTLILAEAVLSYVGVGVDPTTYSWGNMINRARLELAREPMVWWSLLGSFSLMFVLVLSANVFAEAVREAFDPREQA